jgi:plasmid stability protein
MTLTLELPPELENRLRTRAARHGQDVTTYLLTVAEREAQLEPERPLTADAGYLLTLPAEERGRILRAQAEAAAPLYEADLALPPHERELTAFTALDGVDPILEPEDYLRDYLRTENDEDGEQPRAAD